MANDKSTGKSRPVKFPAEKSLTVGKFYYYYTTKSAPAGTPYHPLAVPWIQMRGHWLEAAGFAIGARLKVRVRPGRLVLTVEKQ